MQAASGRLHRRNVLVFPGTSPPSAKVLLQLSLTVLTRILQNPKHTPFELLALLLLIEPSVLTAQKLLLLLALGERSHHQEAVLIAGLDPYFSLFFWEIFVSLLVGFSHCAYKLCLLAYQLSPPLHGLVYPLIPLGVLQDAVIQKLKLWAEVLQRIVRTCELVSPHLRLVLICRPYVIGSAHMIVYLAAQLHDAAGQKSFVSFRSLHAAGETVHLKLPCGVDELYAAFAAL